MKGEQNTESPLERMRRRLYAPQPVESAARASLPSQTPNAPEHWTPELPKEPKKKIPPTVLFLGAAVAFFVIAATATGVMLFLGGRTVSPDKVAITIEDGTTTVSPGKPVPMVLAIRNENPVPITGAILRLQFPEGTGQGDDPSVAFPYYEETIGEIASGETIRRTIRASFFGAEDQAISIPISLEYSTGNSNATFEKDASYDFTLSNAPVVLSVTTLSEVSSGEPLTLSVTVRSNSDTPVKDVGVLAEYPFGFIEGKTDPEKHGSYFMLGTLRPGESRELKITGELTGLEGDQRVFRFTAGSLKDERSFAVSYTKREASVKIAQPFFSVNLSLNHESSGDVIVHAGDPIAALVSWSNGLDTQIQDGTIRITLSGEALDPGTVETTNGFYRSGDRTVVFDRTTASELANLSPGDTGNGSFIFRAKSGTAAHSIHTPSITLSIAVSGKRVGERNVSETLTSSMTRTVKVATDLSLSMRALHGTGAFENSGPFPPKTEQETTYTIELTAGNTYNSVGGATVSLTLPPYVRYTGVANPASGISFNEDSRTVTWQIGEFAAGGSAKGSFQVALLPSVSQKGTSPRLVSDAVLSGVDRFVQGQVSATAPSVTTELSEDSSFHSGDGTVQ